MSDGGTNVGSIVGDLSIKVGEALSRLDQVISRLDKLEATNTRTSRKTVSETDKAKAAYNKLAASLDPVIAKNQRYEKTQETLNAALKHGVITQTQYNKTLDQAKDKLNSTTTASHRFGSEIASSLKSTIAGYVALGVVVNKVIDLTKKSIAEALEASKSQAILANVVKTTGGAAGFTAKQLDEMADKFSLLVGVDDEVIAGAEAILLRYRGITGEQFPRAIQLALDMASAQGEQITSTEQLAGKIEFLGKILGNPARATALLIRQGKTLDEEQQRSIRTFLKQNDLIGAQKVLFAELERQYGGTAIALRREVGGSIQATEVAWNNLLEEFGKSILIPVTGEVTDLGDALTDPKTIKAVQDLGKDIGILTTQIVKLLSYKDQLVDFWRFTAGLPKTVADNIASGLDKLFSSPLFTGRKPIPIQFTPLFTPTTNFSPLGSSGSGTGSVPPPLPPPDLKGLDAAQEKIDRLLKTYQELLDQHTLTKEKQEELLSLYSRSDITLSQREQAEKEINDRYSDRVLYAKNLKQFEDLGPKKAAELASNLLKVNQEERKRSELIDRQRIRLQAQVDIAKDYRNAVQQSKEAWDSIRLPDLDQLMQRLGELSLEQGEQILRYGKVVDPVTEANEQMFDDLRRQHEEFWQNYSDEVRGGWATNIDIIKDEMKKVEAAYQIGVDAGIEGALTVAEKERELALLRIDLLNAELDQIGRIASGWSTLFSTLSSLFGNFGSTAINTINQMISTFQSIQSAGNSIGGQFGGIISSAAPFLAIAGAAISLQRESAARDRARQYTSSASVGFETGGQFETMGRRGRELANALESTLAPIMELIDRTLASLPEIEIRAREDGRGFAAHINDVFLGYFATLEDAIDAAVITALQQIGSSLSDTMRTVLQNTAATTSEELQRDLETGLRFENLGLDDLAIRLQEMFADFRAMMGDIEELGLDSNKVREQFSEDLEKFKNDFLGIDASAADALARLVDVNRILTEQTNRLRQQSEERLASLQAELRAMESGPRTFVSEDGSRGHTESYEQWERVRRDLQQQIDLTLAEIEKLPQGLSEVEIHMSVFQTLFDVIRSSDKLRAKYGEEAMKYAKIEAEAKIKALELQLHVLGLWEQFAGMFEDVANFLRETAGEDLKPRRGGGGGRAETREGVLDFLRSREIALMSDLSGQLAGLNDEYKEEIKAAGKNKDLIAKLTEMRQREIAVLRDQTRAELLTPYLGGRNAGSRSDFDRQRVDINNAYDDYRNNARALGEAIWRINAAEKERLRLLGLEASASAGSRTASTVLEFQNLGQTISFLRDHAEELNVSFSTLMEELQGEQLVAFGDRIFSFLDKYYGDTTGFEQFRMNLERTRFELELGNMRLQFTLLEDLGLLTQETISRVEGIFDFIDTHPIDWDKFIRGGNGGGGGDNDNNVLRFKGYDDSSTSFSNTVDDVEDNLNRLAESFKKAKESILETLNSIDRGDFGIVSPEEAFRAAEKQYQDVIASANRGELVGFEQTSEATRNYIEALKRFSPALAAVELPNIKGNLSLLANATTVRSDNLIYTEKFVQGQEAGNKILSTGFTDLSNSLHTQNGLQSQVVDKLDKIASSQSDLNARLARLESGQVAQKR